MRDRPRVPWSEERPTVQLVAGRRSDGSPVYEEVPVREVGDERYQILASPGMALGIAAEDVFDLDEATGEFIVIQRSGNLAVQLFYRDESVADRIDQDLGPAIARLGGTFDGRDRGVTVFTLPIAAGFAPIESVMASFVGVIPAAQWSYGNVFDDQARPLGWWEDPPFRASGPVVE